ncbi:MAG TPA: hypothetical protein VGO91_07295 [Pyrinomonadaceae bacterium]|jgi:hypothetical protein|nr:hypothetical protein [Pyrinomonadaceae bacterium]
MKRCPTCQRAFTDETLSFCLDDGTPLLDQSGSGPQSYGSNINIKPPQSQGNAPAPTVAYRPQTMPVNQPTPSWQPGTSQPPPRKRKVWPWVLGIFGVLSVLGIGFIVLIIALASMDTNSNNSRSNSNNSNMRASNRNASASNANSQSESNANSSTASNNAAPSYTKGDVEITGINMARDSGKGDVGESVDTFSPSERTVYCVVHLSKLKAGTRVKFTWYGIASGETENKLIQEVDYTTGAFENIVQAHLTFPQDWPTGDYKVDVSVNDGPIRSVEYSVE